MDLINSLIGKGTDLNIVQMSVRTFIIFFIALAMLRIAGVRTFGKKTAMDNVVIIMLGAVLSRAIVGASPFLPIICSSFCMVIIHRLCAMIAFSNDGIGKIIKGARVPLYTEGQQLTDEMKSVQISHNDIMEEIRLQLNQEDLKGISSIYIERTGEISIIKVKG